MRTQPWTECLCQPISSKTLERNGKEQKSWRTGGALVKGWLLHMAGLLQQLCYPYKTFTDRER